MIQEYKYGMFKIDGKIFYDDVKLLGSKIKLWECRDRQITLKDMQELLDINPQLVVIGLGPGGLITVADEVRDMLRLRKIVMKADRSHKACELYNEAVKSGTKVVAIIPARG